jgi:hypothetical protein
LDRRQDERLHAAGDDLGTSQVADVDRFFQSNPDERGVSAQGIDDLRKIAVAQRRSQTIAQILAYDLDGDGSVTKEEITVAM